MKKIFVFAVTLCALVIANISLADDLNDGLVAYYPFNDNAFDISGNMNNGVRSDNVSFVNGIFGQAAKFGGFSLPGSIRVPNSPSLQFASEFSINLWARVDSSGSMNGLGGYHPINGGGCIFAKDHDQYGFFSKVFTLPNGDFYTYFANNYGYSSKIDVVGNINSYTVGKWVNIGIVVNSSESKMYINGSPVGTKANSAVNFSVANSRDLYLGKFSDSWYPFNGALDEVRIYNRALSSGEIQQLSGENKISSEPIGNNGSTWRSSYSIKFIEDLVTVKLRIRLTGDDPGDNLRTQWKNGIEGIWSDRYNVTDGINNYPIKVMVDWVNSDADFDVQVTQGTGRSNMNHWYTDNPGGWPNDYQDEIAAHEAGHMMGLYDEYSEEKGGTINPITKFVTKNALMADLGPVQDRYYNDILEWLEGDKSGVDMWLAEANSPLYPFDPPLAGFNDPMSTVPVPTSMLLFGSGLAGCILLRKNLLGRYFKGHRP